ncbi:hypothetical protein [Natronorubrum sp. FCH18a]|uniref:hypothetical protein n=1 Tax=Natronorubrum sp. FCH18a TaxID=3447018 RepID=UPI003F51872E
MNRTLAITLTVAMIGGLMFIGFAGTAAAQDAGINVGDIDQETGDATAVTQVSVDQNNNNAQVGESAAVATSYSDSDSGSATSVSDATSSVTQGQSVGQSNSANVDAVSYAESGDNTIDIGHLFDIDLDLGNNIA